MYPDSSTRLAGQRAQIGSASGDGEGFFSSSDGPSFKDVLDTINPLQHIPIVSSIYQSLTGDVASPASQLAGGTLLGGPLGFVSSLFNVIFEQQTGHTVSGALYAAVTGDDSTQTASADSATPVQTADASDAAASALDEGVGDTQTAAPVTPVSVTATPGPSASTNTQQVAMLDGATAASQNADQQVLSLFGAQAASAHASYQKAQLLPYLKDVNSSTVM